MVSEPLNCILDHERGQTGLPVPMFGGLECRYPHSLQGDEMDD